MNKRFLRNTLIVITLLATLGAVLTACNTEAKETTFYKKLDSKIVSIVDSYNELLDKLASETTYSYKLTGQIDRLSNFDNENKLLPSNVKDKNNESGRNKFERVSYEYEYIQVNNDIYIKIEYKDSKRDENGIPLFEDEACKTNLYQDSITIEYKVVAGNLKVIVNDLTFYDGIESEYEPMSPFWFLEGVNTFSKGGILLDLDPKIRSKTIAAGAFAANKTTWFTTKIFTSTMYFAKAEDSNLIPYRESEHSDGYGEDLSFDWENIFGVESLTTCFTAKKGQIKELEYYVEDFVSNKKTTNQIWDSQTVTTWQGDHFSSIKINAEFTYPDKKNSISIPN
ncbi:MAG: hypothetical protein LBE09_01515 [Christensenellaceae bacterium]|jgi:hypothetical protein|nr:hypothetical protein [Christensenellaceae bacterium]